MRWFLEVEIGYGQQIICLGIGDNNFVEIVVIVFFRRTNQ